MVNHLLRNKNILLLVIIFIASVINWIIPVLRFTNNFANAFFSLLVSLIPIILCVIGFIKLTNLKIELLAFLGYLVLVPISFLFFIVFCFKIAVLPPLQNNSDGSFEKLYQIKNEISIYRTNGGATTAYGIIVRQEKKIFPVIIIVKTLFEKYRLDDINYDMIGNTLELYYWDKSKLEFKEIEIKRFLYF